jgi:hypothetical protein
MHTSRRSRSALMFLLIGVFAAWWGVSVFAQMSGSAFSSVPLNSTLSYMGGPIVVHTTVTPTEALYTGEISIPSACDTLGTGIAAKGQDPAHVTLLFTLSAPQTGCAAAQSLVTAPFAVSVTIMPGTKKPVFDGVTVNGVIMPITLVGSN